MKTKIIKELNIEISEPQNIEDLKKHITTGL